MKIYLDHIGIACDDLDQSSNFWKLIGLLQGDDELVEDQGVITRFFSTSSNDPSTPKIELLQPTGPDTPIGKFLSKRGPGVQQVCFRVEDLEAMIALLLENDIQMIDNEPRKGAHGALIAFVHPKSTGGVLVELAQK
ncbi:MAG TPA: methylmalonyl-CoA epimerase [Candidatus Poseidoniales archaeon]|nr:MAG TPA: methylmalonyl-CoA epimerase [Candidatus Poseidoniales archaeon]HIH56969.1 methylmalonyl-CoA epimerase [Candidatus Poseidoniaceae archaeon]